MRSKSARQWISDALTHRYAWVLSQSLVDFVRRFWTLDENAFPVLSGSAASYPFPSLYSLVNRARGQTMLHQKRRCYATGNDGTLVGWDPATDSWYYRDRRGSGRGHASMGQEANRDMARAMSPSPAVTSSIRRRATALGSSEARGKTEVVVAFGGGDDDRDGKRRITMALLDAMIPHELLGLDPVRMVADSLRLTSDSSCREVVIRLGEEVQRLTRVVDDKEYLSRKYREERDEAVTRYRELESRGEKRKRHGGPDESGYVAPPGGPMPSSVHVRDRSPVRRYPDADHGSLPTSYRASALAPVDVAAPVPSVDVNASAATANTGQTLDPYANFYRAEALARRRDELAKRQREYDDSLRAHHEMCEREKREREERNRRDGHGGYGSSYGNAAPDYRSYDQGR